MSERIYLNRKDLNKLAKGEPVREAGIFITPPTGGLEP